METETVYRLWRNNALVIPRLNPEDDAEKVWGKDLVKAVDIGMKAYGVDKMPDLKDKDINTRRTWFFMAVIIMRR